MSAISELKEYCDKMRIKGPDYRHIGKRGPEHAPNFEYKASLLDFSATGQGLSKKAAKEAAAVALRRQVRDSARSVAAADNVEASSGSAKNELQEYMQTNGLPLPSYDTTRVGGPDDLPEHKCTVKVRLERDGAERSFDGFGVRVKEAQQNAAEEALLALGEKRVRVGDFEPHFSTTRQALADLRQLCCESVPAVTLVLADLDNVHNVPTVFRERADVGGSLIMVGFASRLSYYHYAVRKRLDSKPHVHIVVHEHAGRDVTDMCLNSFMSYALADETVREHLAQIVLVSRDTMAAASKAAVEFMQLNRDAERAVPIRVLTDEVALGEHLRM